MSNYSDDDYLRLLAKYDHAERLLAAAREPAPPAAQGEYDDHTAAIIATARFTASYAKRANEPAKVDSVFLDAIADALAALQATVELIKCQHNALNVDLRAAQARIAELEAALERIDRESREEMGACQDVFDLGEIARAALAPVSGFNEPEPHTPQYPPHVVPTWGKP
jgi:hypothetical protein